MAETPDQDRLPSGALSRGVPQASASINAREATALSDALFVELGRALHERVARLDPRPLRLALSRSTSHALLTSLRQWTVDLALRLERLVDRRLPQHRALESLPAHSPRLWSGICEEEKKRQREGDCQMGQQQGDGLFGEMLRAAESALQTAREESQPPPILSLLLLYGHNSTFSNIVHRT
jgi:hypothetical protein